MSGINDIADKININMPGADGGGLNGMLAAMMANKDSGGMKEMWPLILLFLLRRGGLEGDVSHVANTTGVDRCEIAVILSKLGELQAAGPLTTSQVQAFLATQTGEIANQISQQTLFVAQGFANLGDKVTNTAAAGIAAGQANTNQILSAIQGVKDQATGFRVSDLERQLTVSELRSSEDRIGHRFDQFDRRFDQVEVNVTQNVSNTATANATAVTLNSVLAELRCLRDGHNQLATNVSRITQFGTGNVAVPSNNTTNQQG